MKRMVLLFLGLLPLTASAQSLEELYPAPWIKADNPSITRALAEADIDGCDKYRYRISSGSKSEFLVYCLRGVKATQAFMVWPNIHKLMGPYPPDPSLP
ncbi:hypothetical protein [Pseudomonas sp. MWU349]|uniref:hypothetical protein n=1 Tax=Pseudomonas sp. MWU349 TaxID=2802572 RepID=UPI001B33E275|nr:hypothetical protein [Pseudomonas sp. MWU349]